MMYDLMTVSRLAGEYSGAVARIGSQLPYMKVFPHASYLEAFGSVVERSFSALGRRPEWDLMPVFVDGAACKVKPVVVNSASFGDLVHFSIDGRHIHRRSVFLVAPMSGHYATLLREQVATLLPHADVWVTDWHNARDVPLGAGKFALTEYVQQIQDWIEFLANDSLHIIAVCQPVPLVCVAVSRLVEAGGPVGSLTLIGGPVDPGAAPTSVTDFGARVSMPHLSSSMIRVGSGFAGQGRLVYPGYSQLSSFVSMNVERHAQAFTGHIFSMARGEGGDDGHNRFYDEYLAVMDLPAEFYLETVSEIFQKRALAKGALVVDGRVADLSALHNVPIIVVEGARDDICAPGQCSAIFDLVPMGGRRLHILAPDSGHYGIFAGKGWRNQALPEMLDFWEGRNF